MAKLKKAKATAAIVNFFLSIIFWLALVITYVGFHDGSWIMVLAISNSAFGAGLGFAILFKYGLVKVGRKLHSRYRKWKRERKMDPELLEEIELIRTSQ